MAEKPEERARAEIDRLLAAAGWSVQSMSEVNIHAARGVAIREFPLKTGHGFADYLQYLDAKNVRPTLTVAKVHSGNFHKMLCNPLPA